VTMASGSWYCQHLTLIYFLSSGVVSGIVKFKLITYLATHTVFFINSFNVIYFLKCYTKYTIHGTSYVPFHVFNIELLEVRQTDMAYAMNLLTTSLTYPCSHTGVLPANGFI
jgi:hypothetical protein